MAIDPDTYEPKELSYADMAANSVLRSLDAITAAKEYLDDAVDQAARSEKINDSSRKLIESARELTKKAGGAIALLTTEANITGEEER